MDNIDTAVSQSHLNSQIRVTPFSTEVKGKSPPPPLFVSSSCLMSVMHNIYVLINLNTCFILVPISLGNSMCVDAASMMDDTGINPANRDHQASVMHPPTKRQKLYAFLVHIYHVV